MSIRVMSEFFGLQLGSANRKMVALRLADFADDGGRGIWPTVARVAAECELSVRTVQRVLDDFVSEGMLIVVKPGGGGRGSSTRYDFDLDRVRARAAEIAGGGVAGDAAIGCQADTLGAGPVQGVSDDAKGDSGASLGCHGDTRTVIEPSTNPPEREGARERKGEGQPEASVAVETPAASVALPPADVPGRADFDKRVQRFCSGAGYAAGTWPEWDRVALGWIAARFADLSPAERADAERWRDAYLLDCRDRKSKPMGVGVFLRDRAWNALAPAVLERSDRMRASQLAPEDRAKPDGWAACLGPVGMAWLFAELIAGPPAGAPEPGTLWFENRLKAEWPAVNQWKALQQAKGGVVFAERWHALKPAMEAVPAGAETHADWITHFDRQGWPWLSALAAHPVLWAPKGGPGGLADFIEQLETASAGGASGDAGGPRDDHHEAAE